MELAHGGSDADAGRVCRAHRVIVGELHIHRRIGTPRVGNHVGGIARGVELSRDVDDGRVVSADSSRREVCGELRANADARKVDDAGEGAWRTDDCYRRTCPVGHR